MCADYHHHLCVDSNEIVPVFFVRNPRKWEVGDRGSDAMARSTVDEIPNTLLISIIACSYTDRYSGS